MQALFGKKKTPEQMLKQNQRALNRTIRELDREKTRMEQQEKKVIAEIKKMAKQGQMDAVKIMAKDLVRTRNFIKRFILMKANIQAVSLKVQTLRSQNAMANAMKGVSKALKTMNTKMKLPQIQKIMMEFERESEIMDMKEEMMNDAIDDVMEGDDDEEESDVIVSQVLDELGLSLTDDLVGIPSTGGALNTKSKETGKVAQADGLSDADADLQARLDNLRRE
ncbi:charged multivesicular body protein 2a [Strongylocentrotus purpuratus]|uniref:Charged multivesicular body protein 2a n=1 Tax=Strongylocentrotus purpuratus TaxID=7668 RepID=A0A7M7TG17_STRPU|nr:charged multivesicular body protein 2a [Strongylocentrotus purpuratus]|eukprot:XP_780405.1 PREDICTED: charged multivesicular body protein 2a [Strongylocentrotus purpuratus]